METPMLVLICNGYNFCVNNMTFFLLFPVNKNVHLFCVCHFFSIAIIPSVLVNDICRSKPLILFIQMREQYVFFLLFLFFS